MQAVGRHRNRLRKGHAKDRKQQCISISIEDSVSVDYVGIDRSCMCR